MTTTQLLKTLLAVTLLTSAAAHAADNSIVIAMEDGKQIAAFKLNGSACTLKADVVRCLPASASK